MNLSGGRTSEFVATSHLQFSLLLSSSCSCCHEGQLTLWSLKPIRKQWPSFLYNLLLVSAFRHSSRKFLRHGRKAFYSVVQMTARLYLLLHTILPSIVSHGSTLFPGASQERENSKIYKPRDNRFSSVSLMDGWMRQGLCVSVCVWQRFVYSVVSACLTQC